MISVEVDDPVDTIDPDWLTNEDARTGAALSPSVISSLSSIDSIGGGRTRLEEVNRSLVLEINIVAVLALKLGLNCDCELNPDCDSMCVFKAVLDVVWVLGEKLNNISIPMLCLLTETLDSIRSTGGTYGGSVVADLRLPVVSCGFRVLDGLIETPSVC